MMPHHNYPDPTTRVRDEDLAMLARQVVQDRLSFNDRLNEHVTDTPDLLVSYIELALGLTIRTEWSEVADGGLPGRKGVAEAARMDGGDPTKEDGKERRCPQLSMLGPCVYDEGACCYECGRNRAAITAWQYYCEELYESVLPYVLSALRALGPGMNDICSGCGAAPDQSCVNSCPRKL